MSHTVKRGKLAEREWKEGDIVFISYGRDRSGGWWWVEANIRGRMRDISRYRTAMAAHFAHRQKRTGIQRLRRLVRNARSHKAASGPGPESAAVNLV